MKRFCLNIDIQERLAFQVSHIIVILIFFFTLNISNGLGQIPLPTTPSWNSADTMFTLDIDLADIDNDGDLDLAAANYAYPTGAPVAIYYNINGVLETAPSWLSSDSAGNRCLDWGDYDGDGYPELAVGRVVVKGEDGQNVIYDNVNGTLTSLPTWISQDSEDTYTIKWVDFDNDGDLDLFTANQDGHILVYRNELGIISTVPEIVFPSFGYTEIAFGDLENDGDLDIFVSAAMHLKVFPNIGGSFSSTPVYTESDSDMIHDIAIGDIDNDDDLDVGVARFHTIMDTSDWKGYNGFFRSNGSTLTASPVWRSADARLTSEVIFADLDNDNYPELVAGNHAAWDASNWVRGEDVVYYNVTGNLLSIPAWISDINDLTTSICIGDIDNGGLVADTFTYIGTGTRSLFYLPHNNLHKILSVVVAGDTLAANEYCYNLEDGWISLSSPVPSGDAAVIVYLYSHSLDLVVGNQGQKRIYLNTNTSNPTPPPLAIIPPSKPQFPNIKIAPRNTQSTINSMMTTVNPLGIYEGWGDPSTFNFNNIRFWRIEAQWEQINSLPNFYSVKWLDYKVKCAYERDTDLCVCVYYVPWWLDSDGNFGPNDLTANSAFFQILIERYKPGGILGTNLGWDPQWGVNKWSMENEPTSPAQWGEYWFWNLTALVQQMQYSYSLVKTLQPESVFGGPNFSYFVNAQYDEWILRNSMNDFYNGGARGYFDVMFQQFYHYGYGDVDPAMDYNTENLLWMISEIMNEHGDYNTPIWATEAGFYLSTWTYLRIRYQWTMNAELFACTRMERVTHNFIDFSPEQNEALDAQAGLISGTVFDYREMVPYPITRDTTIVFAFLNPDTRHSYQVRTKEDPPPYFPFTLNINTPYAIKVDMYGDTTDIVVQGSPGNYYIEFDSLDANPIVVVEQFSDIFAGNIAEWDSDILTKLYPTPFNEMVKIEYCLPEAMMVKLEIFNTLGQKIASLENSNKIGGIYQTEWNGKDLRGNLCASGIYFISFTGDETISHNSYRETKKILLIR